MNEAWVSVRANKLRSFLTVLGIFIGVCAVVLMVATGQTVRNEINRELESFGGNKLIIMPGTGGRGGLRERGTKHSLKYNDYLAIKRLKNVKNVSPLQSAMLRVIYGANNWLTSIIGTNTEYLETENYEIASGNMFSEKDMADGNQYAVLGQTVVEKLYNEGEDPIGTMLRINGIPFMVVGTLKAKGGGLGGRDADDIILAPLFAVKRNLTNNRVHDSISTILLVADDDKTLPFVENRVTLLLQTRHSISENAANDFDIMNLKEIAEKIDHIGFILTLSLVAIASISLLVGSIGIMNMMLVSVTERIREIGIRKTVGAKDRDIMLQFLLESIFISAIGSLMGMIFGLGISQIIGKILQRHVPISIFTVILSMFIAVVVGIVSGIVPALKATRLDPTEALRHQ
jgi:putative ABC transport system permease protein